MIYSPSPKEGNVFLRCAAQIDHQSKFLIRNYSNTLYRKFGVNNGHDKATTEVRDAGTHTTVASNRTWRYPGCGGGEASHTANSRRAAATAIRTQR
jgi:hypothetical protein